MFRNIDKRGTRVRIFAVGAAACAVVGLAACSAPAATPAATATKSASQPAKARPAATNRPASAASKPAHRSVGTAAARGKLPGYQPSKVMSKSAGSTVLTSPDSVRKIGTFYRRSLAASGWHLASSSMGPYHASFTAYRSNEGASISVYPRAGGSGISISTHPR